MKGALRELRFLCVRLATVRRSDVPLIWKKADSSGKSNATKSGECRVECPTIVLTGLAKPSSLANGRSGYWSNMADGEREDERLARIQEYPSDDTIDGKAAATVS